MSTEPDDSTETRPEQRIGAETKQLGDVHREQAVRKQQRRRRVIVRESLEHGTEALVSGDYARAGRIASARLQPALEVTDDDLPAYDDVLADSPLAWDYESLSLFLEDGAHYTVAADDRQSATDHARWRAHGYDSPTAFARRVVRRAFKSLESVAVAQGLVPGELAQSSDVLGHALKLGIKWQRMDYETPDEIQVVNPDIDHPPFSMNLGLPGNGKSTGIDTLALDAYYAGQKVIDLVDFDELENGLYDVPLHDDALREKREQLGLPASLAESDRDPPDLEILHPLCEGLCNANLPYDIESNEWTVTPFVIPVADLDHATLAGMLPNLTQTREEWLNTALDRMGDDDWALADLQREILHTEADEGVKRRLHSSIEEMRSWGFLGTRSHEYAIDWDRIFTDAGTITAFTSSFMDQDRHKLMVAAYLLDAIYRERQSEGVDLEDSDSNAGSGNQYPTAQIVIRELQEVAPGQAKLSGDDGITAIKTKCIQLMQLLGEKRRHVNAGILADTQQWTQINARVRSNVDRVFMYANSVGTVMSLFQKLTGDTHEYHARSVEGYDPGTCSVIGSQWISTEQSFLQPVNWAPPLCHHYDPNDWIDGWHARREHLGDRADFRPSPYSMGSTDPLDEYVADQPTIDRSSPEGFEEFIKACIEYHEGKDDPREPKAAVWDAYQGYAAEHDLEIPGGDHVFGRWVREWYPEEDVADGKTRKSASHPRMRAYLGIGLTETGREYMMDTVRERDEETAYADTEDDDA